MAEEPNPDWSTNSNEAINISLVTPGPGGAKAIATFKPALTYALFGEQESIFGYKGLKIYLQYNACDMRPNVSTHYTRKYKQVGETEALDLQPVLKEFLPNVAFQKVKAYEEHIKSADFYKNWKPPGKLFREFEVSPDKRQFEVWTALTSKEDTVQFLQRIQILVPFFIDGGTLIDLREDGAKRWTIFFLFERKNDLPENVSPYVFMGYATVYRFYPIGDINRKISTAEKRAPDFHLPFPKPEEPRFRCRARISQFVILPPFQGIGLGSLLYQSIYTFFMGQRNVIELTVEDPNEDFDKLRDMNDLTYLRTLPAFREVSIKSKAKITHKGCFVLSEVLDTDAIEKLRVKSKIAPRQFSRVLEIQLLSKIPSNLRQFKIYETYKGEDEKQLEQEKEWKDIYRLWLLIVKSRLHKHNREALMQIDKPDRAEHLDAAAGGVQAAYEEMLEPFDKKSHLFIAPGMGKSFQLETSSPDPEEQTEAKGEEEKTGRKEKRAAGSMDISADEPQAKKVKSDSKGLATREKSGDDDAAADKEVTAASSTNQNATVEASSPEAVDEEMDDLTDGMEEVDPDNIITGMHRTRGRQINWAKAEKELPGDDEEDAEDGDFDDKQVEQGEGSDVEMETDA